MHDGAKDVLPLLDVPVGDPVDIITKLVVRTSQDLQKFASQPDDVITTVKF
jgi:hypothetical protein